MTQNLRFGQGTSDQPGIFLKQFHTYNLREFRNPRPSDRKLNLFDNHYTKLLLLLLINYEPLL